MNSTRTSFYFSAFAPILEKNMKISGLPRKAAVRMHELSLKVPAMSSVSSPDEKIAVEILFSSSEAQLLPPICFV